MGGMRMSNEKRQKVSTPPTSVTFNHRATCSGCDRKAKKLFSHVYFYKQSENGQITRMYREEDDKYTGNMILIGKTSYGFKVWDGESYYFNEGYFCTKGCATDFANRIVRHRKTTLYVRK